MSTNERLEQEAQAVLDVIENPDVAQALRQDKMQNLQYLKDHYNVRSSFFRSIVKSKRIDEYLHTAHTRTNQRPLPLWPIPILIWELQRRSRLPLPLPRALNRQ